MNIDRRINTSDAVIPLVAALPYVITGVPASELDEPHYDAQRQRPVFAGRRDYSTCREDESVGGGISFTRSKSDTKKDD